MLKKLPEPSKRHLDNLDRILTDICDQYGLSDQDLQERLDIANSVQAFLSESVPGTLKLKFVFQSVLTY